MLKRSLKFILFCSFIFSTGLLSCDSTLKPVDKDFGIYAVYGVLDLRKDINYIRVRDLNVPFTEDATREIDAEVTLENLDSGFTEVLERNRWFFNGVYQHNFKVEQEIEANTEYQFTITRSDDTALTLDIVSPTQPEPVAAPINEDCYTPISVSFAPVYDSTIEFFIEYDAVGAFNPVRQGGYLLRNDGEMGKRAVFTFTPVEVMKLTPKTGGTYRCTDLLIPEFNIIYRHFSEGFYEKFYENKFEAFESTQRFGSYYEDTLTIPIDDSRVCPPDCLTKQPKSEEDE